MKEGEHDLNSLSNPFAATLDPIYKREIGLNYIMYSDQTPQRTTSDARGHTKGNTSCSILYFTN